METQTTPSELSALEQCGENKLNKIVELLKLIEQMTPHQFDMFLQTLIDDGRTEAAEMFRRFKDLAKGKALYNSNANQSREM